MTISGCVGRFVGAFLVFFCLSNAFLARRVLTDKEIGFALLGGLIFGWFLGK
jgi:hypothetical protein